MSSFFSDDDNAAREHNTKPPQQLTHKEVVEHSHKIARRNLPGALQSIKEAYTSGSKGVSLSFSNCPAYGPITDPVLDNLIMAKELIRLIEAETGLKCILRQENSGPNRSGISITFQEEDSRARLERKERKRISDHEEGIKQKKYGRELERARRALAARSRRRRFCWQVLPMLAAIPLLVKGLSQVEAYSRDFGFFWLVGPGAALVVLSVLGRGIVKRLNKRDRKRMDL